ncbi:SMI1/KNR4 family protein [Streptomyces sp. NPDC003077]|uniref:SMI1/KNR4 family protein n=1 Tax=Streptomyces sp. NPDC003077 TaxID=3154443 RepID=UPI0033AAAD9A
MGGTEGGVVSEAVTGAWRRIESWLEVRAPASHRSLRPPASEGALGAAEAEWGGPLPEGPKALLRLHDGAQRYAVAGDAEGACAPDAFLGGYTLLPLSRMTGLYRLHTDDRLAGGTWWGERWLPWCAKDGDRVGLFLDGASGRMGRWGRTNGPTAGVYPSLVHYLTLFAEALETGRGDLVRSRWVPGLACGCLLWGDPDRPPAGGAGWVPVHR